MRLKAAFSLIPQDLITLEILPRLPIKSLLRFKSVCKTWKTLISYDVNFSNLHLEFQHQNNKEYSLLYVYRNPWLVYIKDDPSQLGKIDIENYMDEQDINHIHNDNNNSISVKIGPLVLGSSNGSLCFLDPHKRSYVLWNPATRTRRLIRVPPRIYSRSGPSSILCQGFGYSPSSDDYKIVILCKVNTNPNLSVDNNVHACVFTTRTSEWRPVKLDPTTHGYSIIADQNCKPFEAAVQVGEALHWGLYSFSSIKRTILAFDLANDSIHLVLLPEPMREKTNYRRHPPYLMKWPTIFISKIRRHLCVGWLLMPFGTNTGHYYTMEVWMLERYGEPESWKMFFSLKYVSNDNIELHNLLEIKDDSGKVLVPLYDGKCYTFEPLSCVNQTEITVSQRWKPSFKPGSCSGVH